jgi:hypothetical protein
VTTKEFISLYLKKHTEAGEKIFPDDFTVLSSAKFITLPYKSLVIGNDLFGKIEILSTDGATVYQADDIYEAKYLIYAKKYSDDNVAIPANNNDVKTAVLEYEKYLDLILEDIKEKLMQNLIDPANLHTISNEIFMKLNLVRY